VLKVPLAYVVGGPVPTGLLKPLFCGFYRELTELSANNFRLLFCWLVTNGQKLIPPEPSTQVQAELRFTSDSSQLRLASGCCGAAEIRFTSGSSQLQLCFT
jgi:hypothetical protein